LFYAGASVPVPVYNHSAAFFNCSVLFFLNLYFEAFDTPVSDLCDFEKKFRKKFTKTFA
jgi:hypothetical protein